MPLVQQFFELRRDWPEGYAGLTLKRVSPVQTTHLSVYDGPCDETYLRKFRIERFKPGYLPDLLPNNFGWFLASPRLCQLLQNTDSKIKAFIQPLAGMEFPDCHEAVMGYSLLSATHVIECLDETSPTLTWFDSERTSLEKFTHLRLLKNRIPASASFFALAKVVSLYVVSDVIHDAILKNKYSGMYFKECETV